MQLSDKQFDSNSIKERSVDLVIFDLDGTLIDSIVIYTRILSETLSRLKLPLVSKKQIFAATQDGGFDWDLVLPDLPKKDTLKIISEARKIIQEIAPALFHQQLKLIAGADKTIKTLAVQGFKIGIVTSTHRKYLDLKIRPLETAGSYQLINAIVAIDDVQNAKPSPDPLIECARKVGIPPHRCVYVGDSNTDIIAGKSAGMMTIGVLSGRDDYDILRAENPDFIVPRVDNIISDSVLMR